MGSASLSAGVRLLPLGSKRLLALATDERLVEQVRRGNDAAFEVVYERYSAGILGFCRHMLGSPHEAEEAVQHVFAAAYRDLTRDDRAINLKPWLYAIARNRCLSALRARREMAALEGELATAGLHEQVERRAELRDLLRDLRRLPEDQRAALLLAEVGDLSHAEVADVLGCGTPKVKALVFRARTGLMQRCEGREMPCEEVRLQLANARGGSLRRSELRHHLHDCAGCQAYREGLTRQRAMLAIALPVVPSLALKNSVLAAGGTGGASAAGGGGGAAGGGLGAVATGSTGGTAVGGVAGVGGPAAAGGMAAVGGSAAVGGAAVSTAAIGGTIAKVAVVSALIAGGVVGGEAALESRDAVAGAQGGTAAVAKRAVERAAEARGMAFTLDGELAGSVVRGGSGDPGDAGAAAAAAAAVSGGFAAAVGAGAAADGVTGEPGGESEGALGPIVERLTRAERRRLGGKLGEPGASGRAGAGQSSKGDGPGTAPAPRKEARAQKKALRAERKLHSAEQKLQRAEQRLKRVEQKSASSPKQAVRVEKRLLRAQKRLARAQKKVARAQKKIVSPPPVTIPAPPVTVPAPPARVRKAPRVRRKAPVVTTPAEGAAPTEAVP